MNAKLRKGWCPGALRPMEAKDGLLVRLRLTGGILPATTAHALADLAAQHGNGLFDLSARANLQMRGIREAALPALHDDLRALGLLDTSTAGEAVRNVIASPLAGLHDGIDITPLVVALERRLVEDAALHALPGKFGFLIDDGSLPTLADVAADVRFDWMSEGLFALSVGGTRAEAIPIASCSAADLVGHAARIGRVFLSLARSVPEARRMRHLVEALDADAVAEACGRNPSPACGRRWPDEVGSDEGTCRSVTFEESGGQSPHPTSANTEATFSRKREKEIARQTRGLSYFRLAAPYGRLDAVMLTGAAALAEKTPHAELRLTPWRAILIPGVTTADAPAGFISDPADPRLAIAACPGATGCARGTTDTHGDANALAHALPLCSGIAVHVSGCEKGCAKPSRSSFTLVARNGRYDLVRDGRAGDAPTHRNLDLIAVKRRLDMEFA